MGILNFLKNILTSTGSQAETKKPEQPKNGQIAIADLETWFSKKEIEFCKGIEQTFQECKAKLPEEIKRCGQALATLRSAKPRYSQLYEQSKELAEGNRAAFIIAVENLLRETKIPDSLEIIPDFVQGFDYSMTTFTTNSNRAFIISKEFFTDNTLAVWNSLQEIDKLANQLKIKLRENKIEELWAIKKQIAELFRKFQKSKELGTELKEVETKLTDINSQIELLKKNYEELLKSQEFQQKQNLETELTQIQGRIKAQENEVYGLFAELDTPLRKLAYSNSASKKLIEKYVRDPISAISGDSDFKFREILIKLKNAMDAGEVGLKDKKRSSALQAINKLTREYLCGWLESHMINKAREAELQAAMDNLGIAVKEAELKMQLQKLEAEQDSLAKRKATISRVQKRINLAGEVEKVSSDLSALLGSKTEIQSDRC